MDFFLTCRASACMGMSTGLFVCAVTEGTVCVCVCVYVCVCVCVCD